MANNFKDLREQAEAQLSDVTLRRYLIEEQRCQDLDPEKARPILAGYIRAWGKTEADLGSQNRRRMRRNPYHKHWEATYNPA